MVGNRQEVGFHRCPPRRRDFSPPGWGSHFWLSCATFPFDMKLTLQGRAALVTGAAKRIVRAVAVRLATEGADVVIHYNRSKPEPDAARAEVGKLGRKGAPLQAERCHPADI